MRKLTVIAAAGALSGSLLSSGWAGAATNGPSVSGVTKGHQMSTVEATLVPGGVSGVVGDATGQLTTFFRALNATTNGSSVHATVVCVAFAGQQTVLDLQGQPVTGEAASVLAVVDRTDNEFLEPGDLVELEVLDGGTARPGHRSGPDFSSFGTADPPEGYIDVGDPDCEWNAWDHFPTRDGNLVVQSQA